MMDVLHAFIAHAYMVPGMLFTFNTTSKEKGIQVGFNAYPDIDYSDFATAGIAVTPILTPYVTASYDFRAPESYPIIGGGSIYSLSLGYENPLSATVAVEKDTGAPLALDSTGYVTVSAGILDSLTSLLTWDAKFPGVRREQDVLAVYGMGQGWVSLSAEGSS